MKKIATVYCLLYGNHFKLHKRLIESLRTNLPKGLADLIIWCNTVGEETKVYLRTLKFSGSTIFSDENMPKYKVMGMLFRGEYEKVKAPTTPWVIWFDDDSHIKSADWWKKTLAFIRRKKSENICYLGQPWYVHYLPGQWRFVESSRWFRDIPPKKFPTKSRTNKPGVRFAQGSYWWLRTDILRKLNWPDWRLNHNGGDTLLGEAIRQQGLPFHEFQYGVKINDGKRRGLSEAPAGATNRKKRR